jgi:serine/threonine protein kinase
MSDKRDDALIGAQLGQYTIIQEIGRGGMATVYSATQRSMNRTVAIKVLPRHFLHDPGFLERFEREVEVISGLEHPHILPIYDYGEAEGVPYIAMRYLGGGSMAQMVRRGVPQLDELRKPFTQIAEALDYAHQQGIIHRDLKPGNVMLDEYGNAYLSDFGIARVMGSDLTGSAIIGTPAYMSPEQAQGTAIDARSDIYALGIVLFELITGREPYQAETPMSVLLKHLNEPIPPLEQFREGVPKSVQAVIEKATAKDPDARYSSATEMAQAFAAALNSAAASNAATEPDHERTITENLTPLPSHGGTVIGGTQAAGSGINVRAEGAPTSGQPSNVSVSAETANQRQGRSPLPLLIGLIVLIVVGGGTAAVLLPGLNASNVVATPTAPPGSERISTENYAISLPNALLLPNPARRYTDASDANRLLHVYRTENEDDVYVTVALVTAGSTNPTTYSERYYDSQDGLTFIDEEVAPNGDLRRSYRVDGHEELANGQIDVFFIEQDTFLAVVEMYTSDAAATEEEQIAALQTILDSVRVGSNEG